MLIAAYTPSARVRGGPSGKVVVISDRAAGATSAPPAPCTARAVSRKASLPANPAGSAAGRPAAPSSAQPGWLLLCDDAQTVRWSRRGLRAADSSAAANWGCRALSRLRTYSRFSVARSAFSLVGVVALAVIVVSCLIVVRMLRRPGLPCGRGLAGEERPGRRAAAPRRRRRSPRRCTAGSIPVPDGWPWSGHRCGHAPGHWGIGAGAGTAVSRAPRRPSGAGWVSWHGFPRG